MWGDSYPNMGKTANQACCACGGGCINYSPPDSPPGSDWIDSNGRDCSWYAARVRRCKAFGNKPGSGGKNAKAACCACNGGTAPGLN